MSSLVKVLAYSGAAVGAMPLGAMFGLAFKADSTTRRYIQYFAAGTLFAALVVLTGPAIFRLQLFRAAAIGIICGSAASLMRTAALHHLPHQQHWLMRLFIVLGMPSIMAGILLGTSFSLGERQGRLLAVAITPEFLSWGLIIGDQVMQSRITRVAKGLAAIAMSLLIGAFTIGACLLSVPVVGPLRQIMLCCAAVAVSISVAGALLDTADPIKDEPLAVRFLLVGFFSFVLLAMWRA